MADDLVVQGAHVEDGPGAPDEFERLYGSQASYRARVHAVTRGGGARGPLEDVSVDGESDDVLEIETVDGLVHFMTVRTARDQLRERGMRGLEGLEPIRRGASPISSVTRSAFEILDPDVSAALGTLRDELAERAVDAVLTPAARIAMKKIAEWIDRPVDDRAPAEIRRKKPKRRGLYRIDSGLELAPDDRIEATADGHTEPSLLLLHGTFSHTEAAFGGLRRTDEWKQLNRHYAGRMYALEHATLSRTPAENALDLARQLPPGARLHLVSHSRGGLVGEALSLAQAHRGRSLDLALYPEGDLAGPDRDVLTELHQLMADNDLRVERFVRVACPARGTILASRRLDTYAKYLFNALRLLPGVPGTGIIEAVKLVVLTFLDQRADVSVVPGLEAQMPGSAYIKTLNTVQGAAADDNLVSITGDVEGTGLLDRLKVLGADLFFREDHDFVVNTAAMVEGVRRANARVTSFKGPEYSHSNYFRDNDSRKAMASWLLASNVETLPAPAGSVSAVSSVGRGRAVPAIRTALPTVKGTVVIIPDLMGSRIAAGSEVKWPEPAQLAGRGLEEFLDGDDTWKAQGLVAAYEPLIRRLPPSVTVTTFEYRWNEQLDTVAKRLNRTLDRIEDGPVHVIAHGAGCRVLVAADARDDAIHRGTHSRRILLSPPVAAAGLVHARQQGRDALAAALATLSDMDAAEIGPLLVGDDDRISSLSDPLEAANWKPYLAVFGRAAHTWVDGADGALALSSEGDGHTLAAPPDELTSHQVSVPFDRLIGDDAALDLVLRLLDPAEEVLERRPEPRRSGDTLTAAPESIPVVFPTGDDLVTAAMGAPEPPPRERAKLQVRVVHGNLTGAGEMIIVGTQNGTPIAGAERALDLRLDEVLSRHRLLGEYPGPLGTCQLFSSPLRPGADGTLSAGPGPDAAVIGIGDPGELSTGDLTAGVAQAVLRLVAAQPRGVPRELAVATVLIGTVGPGSLAVASAVSAAISGVRRANRRIKDLKLRQHISSLTIYELYEDRAVEALHAATLLQPVGSIAADDDELEIGQYLDEGVDGRPGTPRSDYYAERWRTIRVSSVSPEDDSPLRELVFTETGHSAGAATRVSVSQHEIVEKLVEQSVQSPLVDKQIYNTLYELLVPRSMKGQGRLSEDIMLMLDEHAASLPFEMLATRSYDDGVVPISVEVGVIRRLETTRIREVIRPSPGHKALVIGDPYVGDEQQRLPGAIHEANAVADLLESRGWDVVRLISRDENDRRVDTQSVLNALFAHEYRIIHIAAHGQYDADNPDRSGVYIGPGDFLTAAELEQMQTTPDLVFLNCCHLGSGIGRPDKLASSISRKLIDNGIRVAVAAGWAVDDNAASLFATTFYSALLNGQHLGKSTLSARKLVHQEYPHTNTWGAYQVYGEPAFQLERREAVRESGRPRSRRELHDQVHAIRRRAMFADEETVAALSERLADLVACGKDRGWVQGAEQEVIGEAWRALGDYDKAIAAYETALRIDFGAARFHVISQLSTAHGRQGAQQVRTGGDLAAVERHFGEAERLLENWRRLVTLPDGGVGTPELLMAEANLAQHRLWLSAAPGRDRSDLHTAVAEAAEKFEAAAEVFHKDDSLRGCQHAQYTRLAAIVFRWLTLVGGAASPSSQDKRRWRRHIRELAQAAADAPWSTAPYERTRMAFLDLTSHVVLGDPGVERVAARFTCAFDKGVSRRERESTLQWIDLLLACMADAGEQTARARDALARLHELLERWLSQSAAVR